MRIDIYHHSENELKADLAKISQQIHFLKEVTMTTQAELAQSMIDIAAQADKAKAEVIAKVAELEAAITSSNGTTPEVDAALASLKASVQGIDDLNPDAPAPAPV